MASKYAVLRIWSVRNGHDYPPHVVKAIHNRYDHACVACKRSDAEGWFDTAMHIEDVCKLEQRGYPTIWETRGDTTP